MAGITVRYRDVRGERDISVMGGTRVGALVTWMESFRCDRFVGFYERNVRVRRSGCWVVRPPSARLVLLPGDEVEVS